MTSRIVPVSKAIEILKNENPGSYISRGLIHQALENHEIGFIPVGNRKLVDIDKVQEFLSSACDPKYTRKK